MTTTEVAPRRQTVWYGLMAPAGTPVAVLERVRRAMEKTLSIDEVRNRLAELGAETVGNTPVEFAAELRSELKKWAEFVRAAHIRLD
ncbi:MAG: tripartite tricarboxylate transporter substrate-binding protein [Casimicrobiaceae bacterium]